MARYIHETSIGTVATGNATTAAPISSTVGATVDNHPTMLVTSIAVDDTCDWVLWAKDVASNSWLIDTTVGTQSIVPGAPERLIVDVRGYSEVYVQITSVGAVPGTLTVAAVKVGP